MLKVEKAGLLDIDRLVELRLQYLKEDRGQLKEEEITVIKDRLPAYFQRVLDRISSKPMRLSVKVIRAAR